MRDLAYWTGIGLASIVFSGLFAVILGQFFRNDTPDDLGDKQTDWDGLPSPLPNISPAADFSPAVGRGAVLIHGPATVPVPNLHDRGDTL